MKISIRFSGSWCVLSGETSEIIKMVKFSQEKFNYPLIENLIIVGNIFSYRSKLYINKIGSLLILGRENKTTNTIVKTFENLQSIVENSSIVDVLIGTFAETVENIINDKNGNKKQIEMINRFTEKLKKNSDKDINKMIDFIDCPDILLDFIRFTDRKNITRIGEGIKKWQEKSKIGKKFIESIKKEKESIFFGESL